MNKERLLKVLVEPKISEKSTRLAESARQYVFKVLMDAKKPEIKKAVELMFDVKVESVQTINVRGKTKGFGGRYGTRPFWKKAYVRLAEGQELDVISAQ